MITWLFFNMIFSFHDKYVHHTDFSSLLPQYRKNSGQEPSILLRTLDKIELICCLFCTIKHHFTFAKQPIIKDLSFFFNIYLSDIWWTLLFITPYLENVPHPPIQLNIYLMLLKVCPLVLFPKRTFIISSTFRKN